MFNNYRFLYKLLGLKWDLDFYDLLIIIIAGSIRGSVAFALILMMSGENSALIQVTTYILLIILTVFLGGLMPKILSIILSFREKKHIINIDEERENPTDPNENDDEINEEEINKLYFFKKYWKKLDEDYLKPMFIANYDVIKTQVKFMANKNMSDIYKVELQNYDSSSSPLYKSQMKMGYN